MRVIYPRSRVIAQHEAQHREAPADLMRSIELISESVPVPPVLPAVVRATILHRLFK